MIKGDFSDLKTAVFPDYHKTFHTFTFCFLHGLHFKEVKRDWSVDKSDYTAE
jgi:hypothetical protein